MGRLTLALVLGSYCLCAAIARAQEAGAAGAEAGSDSMRAVFAEQFGTPVNETLVPVQSFVPFDTNQIYASTDTGYHTGTVAGVAKLWAPLGLAPGMAVDEVCVEGRDFSAADELVVDLVGAESGTQSPSFIPPVSTVLASVSSGIGTLTGYVRFCVVPLGGFSFPHLIRNSADFDNANGAHTAQYFIVVTLGAATTIQEGAAVVHWHRTIPDGPGGATFSDVPTGSDYFKYVEALRSAGIILGCDPGSPKFCPEQPVTRAQLALYLARALGVYWPN